ncbi:MAG TPA: carboxypeptidase-like regulatory domain-containing protein [Pyrinomonadaceae bacterium]|nr:carboxypeptidase-like regulatory domain-containing protein [Pyrinomonadaceae bacterium]
MKPVKLSLHKALAIFSVVALALLTANVALAQTGSSSLRGTITDLQGRAIAGAEVTITNDQKNFSRTQTTNDDGAYTFTSIPPGTYRLDVQATGFKKAQVADLRAQIDTPGTFDLQLEVGNISETVSVIAGGDAPINTTDATVGNTFESRRIVELPLNAGNVVGLLSLQPGVTRTGFVNGGRADQSNITLDGVDVNEQQNGLDVVTNQAFSSVLRILRDATQEFRVVTTNPNADTGRSSGAQVSLATKGGTNDWHGSLFHFHRNTVTTANDFFNNKAGRFQPTDPQVISGTATAGEARLPRPPLLRNFFGGSVGAPIKKDRAFFFFAYEGFREATSSGGLQIVPLAHVGQGRIRYETARRSDGTFNPASIACPTSANPGRRCIELDAAAINSAYLAANGITPGVNPNAISFLRDKTQRYVANDTTVGDGINTGGFRFNAPTPTTFDTYLLKLDFNLTDRQTLFVRGNYQEDNIGQVPAFPDTPAPSIWYHPKGFAAGHSWTISNTVVNRFTYGLTRAAFTRQGDQTGNNLQFRFIFNPAVTTALTRVTPVHNFVDDVTYIKGNHTLQFGGNVRLIKNVRQSFQNAFDTLTTNPSGYAASAAVLTSAGADASGPAIFPDVAPSSLTPLRNILSAVIGRFSQYTANFSYDQSGSLLPAGTSADRTFATEEYEAYWQDQWRIRHNVTLTYGLRWSTSTPVYEVNGFQTQPTTSLGEYFEKRVAGAAAGVPFNDVISLDLSGKANGRPGFYKQDWNNFAPVVAVAWQPELPDNVWGKLIGREGKAVFRGGFRTTYDRIGSALAVNFDLSNQLGFASALTIPVNTYNVSSSLAPLFNGGVPDVRTLPGIAGNFNNTISFPLLQPPNGAQRVETSLDDTLTTPVNYSYNFSYAREVGKGLSFELGYVGRFARDLLAQRDIMHFNNLRDPKSGQTWYEAMQALIDLRYAGRPITSVGPIPFFENVLPGIAGTFSVLGVNQALTATQSAYRRIALPSVGGLNVTDYTSLNSRWDDRPSSIFNNTFINPQYAALNTWSTFGISNYNSAQVSVRQRMSNDVVFDFNYTFAHSLDNASGLQNAANFSTASLIFNPLDPNLNYADSDFDVRHNITANWLVGLPVGRGKAFLSDAGKVMNGILGGWDLTGIFRWNSGLPTGATRPFSFQRWATNWQISSGMVRVRPIETQYGDVNGEPNLFADPTAVYQSFRDPKPGEGGDRNTIRYPGYFSLDAGLHKTFRMPWEGQALTFRWEVFNVTNTQRFTGFNGTGLSVDPFIFGGAPPQGFGQFTGTQAPLGETKAGRVMQFALRYVF